MNVVTLNAIESRIATLVVENGYAFAEAIFRTAVDFRDASSKELLFATITFCADLDQSIASKELQRTFARQHPYKVVANLAADTLLLRLSDSSCGDLELFWRQSGSQVFVSR